MKSKFANKFSAYWRLMRADKPIGIYLLLWPTMWALLMVSENHIDWHIWTVFILGVVIMRSAGCVINDYADRHLDGHVMRTKSRPLASGEVSEAEALGLFAVLIGIAFALVLSLNIETILLSLVALLLASAYPFMKRYTHFPQVVLGAAFSWSIPMVFMASVGYLPTVVWILYGVNLLWTVAYDTQYAMVDREDDLKVGIKSTAILFGSYDLAIIAGLQLSMLLILAGLGWQLSFGHIYYLCLLACLLLFTKQAIITRTRQRQSCFQAFLHNHWVGMLIAFAIATQTLPMLRA